MASENVEKVLEIVKNMTLLEASELVKALEEEFGVSAAAPMMAMPMADAAEPEEEQTEFKVMLKEIGDQKIQVIKAVRKETGLGLKEAKALVDNVATGPQAVKEDIAKEDAEKVMITSAVFPCRTRVLAGTDCFFNWASAFFRFFFACSSSASLRRVWSRGVSSVMCSSGTTASTVRLPPNWLAISIPFRNAFWAYREPSCATSIFFISRSSFARPGA